MLLRGGGRRQLLLALAFLPTLAVVVFAYTNRPPIPIAFEPGRLERLPVDGDEARLYSWLRESTPRDAVIVQDPGREGRECTGNTSELPAFSGRSLYADYAQHYLVAPNRDAAQRARVTQALVSGAALTEADASALAALERPIFVVTYAASDAVSAAVAVRLGPPVRTFGAIRVHVWKPD